MATDFRQRGVPLDGIGMQMHLDLSFNRFYTLASFRKNLERFARLGLVVHITEMDVRLPDASPNSLNAQADLYKEVADICMQVSACKLLQTWGVTDRYSWISWFFPGYGWALLWDANYEPKPAYKSLQQVLLQP
jgi:endo-1,4-beta-xylanase